MKPVGRLCAVVVALLLLRCDVAHSYTHRPTTTIRPLPAAASRRVDARRAGAQGPLKAAAIGASQDVFHYLYVPLLPPRAGFSIPSSSSSSSSSAAASSFGASSSRRPPRSESTNREHEKTNNDDRRRRARVRANASRLMSDFVTASGEVIDPYRVLAVSRTTATRSDIKAAYRTLSKSYHPDGLLQRENRGDSLPDGCSTLEDVRDEWERVNLSYKILSDRKTRMKYDRNSALFDNPGGTIGRAVVQCVVWGVKSGARALLRAGMMAAEALSTLSSTVGDVVLCP